MKKVFLLLSIVLILVAVPTTVFLVGQKQELRKKAAPATTLAFSPATITKAVGDMFSLDIAIDTGENQVVVAELHVVYDPAKLEAQSITNSALFPNILASGVVERGSSSVTVGATDVKKPIKGIGSVAVIRFKALEKTEIPVSVRLAPNTFVGGLGEQATNVLVGSTPANITITGQGAATTPMPIETPSPSPTTLPTATPTLSPTVTPTSATTPTPAANTPSSITITAPTNNSVATTDTPTIRGKAAVGATVTVTIYSTPRTVVVTADANGNWSYTPTSPLENGSHNVVASAPDTTGKTQTATATFVVAAGSGKATVIPTPLPIPVSGDPSLTILLVSVGVALLLGGVAFAAVAFL